MAEKHHHLFHHDKANQQAVPVTDTTDVYVAQPVGDGRTEIKHAKHKEHLGELGAAGAAAFALHEKHQGKKDPERAHQHRIQEELAAVAGVGAGGVAFHEHHNKDAAKHAAKAAEGNKHHHF